MDTSTSTETRRAIEAIIMVSDTSVDPSVLAQLLEIPRADVEAICDELAAEYESEGRGFILARVAGGYRYQTHPDTAPYIERFVLEGQNSRLSAAALETLAIVAYKQPISRMQVAAIRGVNVDGVMRTLQQRGYIDETGRDPGPGNATLFGTTPLFLERVGLDSCDDLPPLAAFVPGADVVEALEEGLRPQAIDDLLVIDDADADADGEEADDLALEDLVDEDELDDDELSELDEALAGEPEIELEPGVDPVEEAEPTITVGATGSTTQSRDVPIPKAEPIIEITRPVPPQATAPPGQAPFRSTPGHDGAGETDTETASMAQDLGTAEEPGAAAQAPDASS